MSSKLRELQSFVSSCLGGLSTGLCIGATGKTTNELPLRTHGQYSWEVWSQGQLVTLRRTEKSAGTRSIQWYMLRPRWKDAVGSLFVTTTNSWKVPCVCLWFSPTLIRDWLVLHILDISPTIIMVPIVIDFPVIFPD